MGLFCLNSKLPSHSTLVYIIVPLQESSKSASASLVKRPQPHSSLQDQVDWSLPIKWTPRSSGPSVNWSLNSHKKSGSASLARGLSHTGTASPLSHNKCFPRPSYSHQPLFPQRLQTPLFLSKNCKKKIINLCPNQLVACSCSCC